MVNAQGGESRDGSRIMDFQMKACSQRLKVALLCTQQVVALISRPRRSGLTLNQAVRFWGQSQLRCLEACLTRRSLDGYATSTLMPQFSDEAWRDVENQASGLPWALDSLGLRNLGPLRHLGEVGTNHRRHRAATTPSLPARHMTPHNQGYHSGILFVWSTDSA